MTKERTKQFLEAVRYYPEVAAVDDESRYDDGYWVYLKDGFYWEIPGQHVMGEPNITALKKTLREVRMGCDCNECVSTLNKES